MSGLVQRIRANVDAGCISTRLGKEGCGVSLQGAPTRRLIIDLADPSSPLAPPNERCDYLVVADEDGDSAWLAPMELKRGRFQMGQFVGQLRAGTRAAERIVPASVSVKFRPVAVYGGSIHKAEMTRLRQGYNKVTFRGIREPLRLLKCGSRLTQALR